MKSKIDKRQESINQDIFAIFRLPLTTFLQILNFLKS